jgi:hypothetical protein
VLKRLVLLLVLTLPAAHAQTEWLTVAGDPGNPHVDTIQVDPIPISVSGDHRTMRLRVSRAAEQVNWDGVPYRSYESIVLFDCAGNTARYVEINFYLQPAWTGEVYKSVTYSANLPRWILFREVEPDPYQRIIHAACGAYQRK